MTDALTGAALLHESTKHGTPPAHPERLIDYRRMDPGNRPEPFKEYRGLEETLLTTELADSTVPATAVLSGRKGEEGTLDETLLSTLLFLGAGVTRAMGSPGRRIYFRAAMSAGNLHPVETYVVAGEGAVPSVPPGVHHFSPLRFGLTQLRGGDYRDELGVDTPLTLVLTGIPWRTTWKYGERGWRHLYWDAGTMLANMVSVADAHGLDHRTLVGFDDHYVSDLLGVDGVSEMPLVMLAIGQPEEPPPSPPSPPLSPNVEPIAPRPMRLPLLEEAQAEGELAGEDVDTWRSRGGAVSRGTNLEAETPDGGGMPIEQVILQRGSTRRMVQERVPGNHLVWPLTAASRPAGIDVIGEGTLLDHYVNVHAVEGVDTGAYRLTDSGPDLIERKESLREQSAKLCLGQALGGDSACTVFHCARLDPLLVELGSRGYRAAQLEAGVVSGRLALCAFALGLGATGLTFFDDPVSRFFDTQSQPMLVTAVGVPATLPARSGEPGSPAVLGAR